MKETCGTSRPGAERETGPAKMLSANAVTIKGNGICPGWTDAMARRHHYQGTPIHPPMIWASHGWN